MKKFILVFSLFFGSSLLSANSLAVSDQQFLFGKTQNVKAQLISNDEMAQTEGQFLPWAFYTGVRYGVFFGYQLYKYHRYGGYGLGTTYSGWE